MREMLACQATNDQDPNIALSVVLNKQLIEAKSGNEDVFVAAMFRATAFLVTSRGTFSKFLLKGSKGGCFSPEDESLLMNIQLMMAYRAKITRYFRHCLSAVDRDLLHNICWTPADVFSDLSLSTAVSCWEWIMGARQDLELQVTSSFISAG